MRDYGNYGRPVMLFDAYVEWRDDMRRRVEEGNLDIQEADTRFDFPTFLFGPLRQSMYGGYERVAPLYRKYARVESAPDFRERQIKGLNGMTKPGYVGEHGEFPQMRRTERPTASLVVDTYGGVYSMTRHLIVNDETNELLNSAPTEMGDAAAQFVAETIIALIESNPNAPDGTAMFHSTHGNLGSAALSEDSLAAAIAAMTKQTDDIGRRIRVTPQSLVVASPILELTAKRILRSTQSGATVTHTGGTAGIGTAYFDKGTDNPLQGILPDSAVTYEPFFTDANDWYLFADPSRVPAFAVGFLNGQEAPQVFLKNPEVRSVLGGGGQDPYTFELRSLDWLVQIDFGVAPIDQRGAYKASVT